VEYPSVTVFDVVHATDRYVFLANSSNESVRVEMQGLPGRAIMTENLFESGDTWLVRHGQWEADLGSLEIKAFRLVPIEQD
jgi:hypothetical protein